MISNANKNLFLMNANNMKSHIILTLIFLSAINQVLSQSKYCDIKYGETASEEELERMHFGANYSEEMKEKYILECYQIGVEHNKNKQPILSKPIYACCQNI